MPDLPPIARRIWDMKYRLKGPDGVPLEGSVEETWRRVARALAAVETPDERARWEERFYDALDGYGFIPAGRILAGAGTDRRVTLFNCFVMGTIPDDMTGIFDHLKEAALTMQQGGGIGYDFSSLRPRGAPVKGVGADASGPVIFMDVWDAMCRAIMSAGSRRGAMMATLRCDHPDIEEFIDAKRDPARLRMFNLSVLVTDAFMTAVEEDAQWALTFGDRTFRTVSARALWDRIMQATYDYAEPGVIFIDRINRLNNLWYCEDIRATNPCGEQPLPPYGACLLGSINLARLVIDPFSETAHLDMPRLRVLVATAVRMMDNVVNASNFPLPQQAEEARAKRRIGLGVTGLADALAMCRVRYGSERAEALTGTWLAALRREAYLASAAIAAEKGSFPLFDRDRFLAGENVRSLDEDVQAAIARHGIRNALLTSIAPTGTISLFAGNISSGIEPIFSYGFSRAVLMPDGSRREEYVTDYACSVWQEMHGEDAPFPEWFVDAAALSPEEHIRMQAVAQKYIDSSISKTINLPESISFDDFKTVYLQAWDSGCKGCTTWRPNAVTGAVLSVATAPAPPANQAAVQPAAPAERPLGQPMDRPDTLPGATYKIKWPESDHAIYITLNDVFENGRRRPFEVFINSKNMEHYAWTVALTRMISAVFRRGGDVGFVVEELKAVFDPRGGQWMGGRYVPSLLAAIGDVIERHMIEIGFLPPSNRLAPTRSQQPSSAISAPAAQCPRCGSAALVHQEGCDLCTDCGYSRCG